MLIRFPDTTANPYLAFSALLMAGLDGIRNKIHPGDAMDKDLYDLPAEELKDIPTVCGSLREALEALNADREYLTQGDVFTNDQIDAYIDLKMEKKLLTLSTHRIQLNLRCITQAKPTLYALKERPLGRPFFMFSTNYCVLMAIIIKIR